MNQPLLRDTYVEVNLDNIAYNVRKLKEIVGKDVAMAAVVKANAYGHGAVDIAPTIMENGADMLAVATLTEALKLRNHYKDYEIFIMGYTPDEYLEYVVKNNIMQTVFSMRQAVLINDLSIKYNTISKVQIKYDTGLNRIGYQDCQESIDEIVKIFDLKNIEVQGIFSHLALTNREEDDKQYIKFMNAISKIKEKGCHLRYKHICDSISAIDYPEYRLNMIRPGSILYGLKSYESDEVVMKQALTFKTKIYMIKELQPGEGVSYGYRWKATKKTPVGTLPMGYADGYPRLKGGSFVTIHGKRAPIVGVINMDQCMVDLTDIPEARVGDDVIIYGDGTGNTMNIQAMADLLNTNKNEVVCKFSIRTPRVYTKGGKVVKILNYLLQEQSWI